MSKIVASLEKAFSADVRPVCDGVLDTIFLTQDELDEAEAELARLEAEEETEKKKEAKEAEEKKKKEKGEEEAKEKEEVEVEGKRKTVVAGVAEEEASCNTAIFSNNGAAPVHAKPEVEDTEVGVEARLVPAAVSVVADSRQEVGGECQLQNMDTVSDDAPQQTTTTDTSTTVPVRQQPQATSSSSLLVTPSVSGSRAVSPSGIEAKSSPASATSSSRMVVLSPTPLPTFELSTFALETEEKPNNQLYLAPDDCANGGSLDADSPVTYAMSASSLSSLAMTPCGAEAEQTETLVVVVDLPSDGPAIVTYSSGPGSSRQASVAGSPVPSSPLPADAGLTDGCPAPVPRIISGTSPGLSSSTALLPDTGDGHRSASTLPCSTGETSEAVGKTLEMRLHNTTPGFTKEAIASVSLPPPVETPEQGRMREVLDSKMEAVGRRHFPVLNLQKMTAPSRAGTSDSRPASRPDRGVVSPILQTNTLTSTPNMPTKQQQQETTRGAETDQKAESSGDEDEEQDLLAVDGEDGIVNAGDDDDDVSSVHTSDLSSFDGHISSASSSPLSSRTTSPMPAVEKFPTVLPPSKRKHMESTGTRTKRPATRTSGSDSSQRTETLLNVPTTHRPKRSSRPTRRYSPSDSMFASATTTNACAEEGRKGATACAAPSHTTREKTSSPSRLKNSPIPTTPSALKQKESVLHCPSPPSPAKQKEHQQQSTPSRKRQARRQSPPPTTATPVQVSERRRHSNSDSRTAKRTRRPKSTDMRSGSEQTSSPARDSPVRTSARISTRQSSSH